jgi:hypothetical protein
MTKLLEVTPENDSEFLMNGIYRVTQPIFNISVLSRRPGTGIPGGYWEQVRLANLDPDDLIVFLGQAQKLGMIHGDILKEHLIFKNKTPKEMIEQNQRMVFYPHHKVALSLVDREK